MFTKSASPVSAAKAVQAFFFFLQICLKAFAYDLNM